MRLFIVAALFFTSNITFSAIEPSTCHEMPYDDSDSCIQNYFGVSVGQKLKFKKSIFVYARAAIGSLVSQNVDLNESITEEKSLEPDAKYIWCAVSLAKVDPVDDRMILAKDREYTVSAVKRIESDHYYSDQYGLEIYIDPVGEITPEAQITKIYCLKESQSYDQLHSPFLLKKEFWQIFNRGAKLLDAGLVYTKSYVTKDK